MRTSVIAFSLMVALLFGLLISGARADNNGHGSGNGHGGDDDDDDNGHGSGNGNGNDNSNGHTQQRLEALEELVASLSAASAQDRAQLRAASFQLAASREQMHYNRDIDRAFTIGFTQANTADFNTSVDRIMSHFCTDALFWAAYVNGIAVLSATSFSDIRAVYASVSANNYANFSRHIITNVVMTPSPVNSNLMEFNASIVQPSLKRVTGGQPFKYVDGSLITDDRGNVKSAPITWNWSVGWYHNQWRLNADNSVCMTRFEAWTMSQHDFSATFVHDYILDAKLL